MKNLGKIALLVLLIPHAIFGGVVAGVNSKSVELGDTVTLNLDITGDNVVRPNLNSLCATDILSSNSSTSIQGVNGVYKKSIILSYTFLPKASCEIEPIELLIDGKMQKTEPIHIEVKAVDKAKELDFILSLESNKSDVFVGEPFDLTLTFKQKRNAEAVESKFVAPDMKGFWIKNESKPMREDAGEYILTKVVYTIAPQREGVQNISSAQMAIASRSSARDGWGSWIPIIKWKSYFSNELEIHVKSLPAGVSLIGDFALTATADKSEINANEAVNISVEVSGHGNLEDVKTFKPYINNVTVFDEKIEINGLKLSQKMAFVADEDFVIPPFELKFFNPTTKEIQTISTKEIQIKVKNAKPKTELTLKRDERVELPRTENSQNEINIYGISLGFIVGLACGILIALFKPWKWIVKNKTHSLKEPRNLLVKLMPYKNDVQVQNLIEILEKNIYSNANIKVDKKVLNEILKRHAIG